jgi:hypothetical protein
VSTPPASSYTVADTFRLAPGRVITKDAELTVEGIRGRVRFIQHVTAPSGAEWLDVITVRTGHARSIRPAAVSRVHRRRA